MDVPVLGSSAARTREQARQQDTEPEVIEAVTAFLVYLTPQGHYAMTPNLDAPVTTERLPAKYEVIAGCHVIEQSVSLEMTAELVTMNVLGNMSRMQSDPNYHAMIAQARQQAEAAIAVAAGR